MRYLLPSIALLGLLVGCGEKPPASIPVNHFEKTAENPILRADSTYQFIDPVSGDTVQWQRADVFNPAAILKNDSIYLLYRCEDNPAAALGGRTSRLGLARSADGIHFEKLPHPVLYPANDSFRQYDFPGGCEDPRLVQMEDGQYIVAYTSWNGQLARLSVAFSSDLIHWSKKGPAFAKAYGGKFLNTWSKSGSMVTEMKDGKPVLARIDGKYWMYWGEKGINLAWSDNGADWYPELNPDSSLHYLAEPRTHYFDSDLTECGPPAVITSAGIELLYNGKNSIDERADPKLPFGTYSVGRIIFDAGDPRRVIRRSDTCFLKPTLEHEITGQYAAGTTFAEGLVFFRDAWWLYYGTADSYVGLAVARDIP